MGSIGRGGQDSGAAGIVVASSAGAQHEVRFGLRNKTLTQAPKFGKSEVGVGIQARIDAGKVMALTAMDAVMGAYGHSRIRQLIVGSARRARCFA